MLLTGGLQSAIKAAVATSQITFGLLKFLNSAMANSLRLLQIVLLAVCSMVLTSALTCDKLILDATTIGEIGVSNDIMEMGRYKVSTTKPRNTNKIQALMATLNGASRIRGKLKSRRFSAILQPTDLKKVYTHIHAFDSVYIHTCSDRHT